MTEHDDAWRGDRRETWDDIRVRVHRFLAWLVVQHYSDPRPQSHHVNAAAAAVVIVVVSHGVWIETLLRKYAPDVLGRDKRVYNTDAFACDVVSTNAVFVRIQNVQQIWGHAGHHH